MQVRNNRRRSTSIAALGITLPRFGDTATIPDSDTNDPQLQKYLQSGILREVKSTENPTPAEAAAAASRIETAARVEFIQGRARARAQGQKVPRLARAEGVKKNA